MNSHVVFTQVDDVLKSRLKAYWDKKLPRIQRLLPRRSADAAEIRLTVHRHPKTPGYALFEVRAVAEMPVGTVAAESSGDNPERAIDQVVDTLVEETKRRRELARKDYLWKRKNRTRADLHAADPLLEQHKKAGERDDFFRVLRPLLGMLRDHARRELRVIEIGESLHRGEVTVDDLVDEVIMKAWERFDDRPRNKSLDLWLIELLHETFEQFIKQEIRPHVSLEDEAKEKVPAEVPQVDDQEWWAWLVGDDAIEEEDELLEDRLPDPKTSPVDERVLAEEEKERILSLLRDLPAARRQAFLLHVLEDFTPAEIAMVQNRSESEVQADIEAARETVRRRLRARNSGEEFHTAAASGSSTRDRQ